MPPVKVKLTERKIKNAILLFLIIAIIISAIMYYAWGFAALIGAVIMSVGALFFILYLLFRGF